MADANCGPSLPSDASTGAGANIRLPRLDFLVCSSRAAFSGLPTRSVWNRRSVQYPPVACGSATVEITTVATIVVIARAATANRLVADRIPTRMFNGYGDQVASLYSGMDLKKWY